MMRQISMSKIIYICIDCGDKMEYTSERNLSVEVECQTCDSKRVAQILDIPEWDDSIGQTKH
jgi:DNA-directed RNA polymerase subunit RPC12/RpoP